MLPGLALKPEPGNLLATRGLEDVGVLAPLPPSTVFSLLLATSTLSGRTRSSFAVIVSGFLFGGASTLTFFLGGIRGFLGSGFGGSSVEGPAPGLDPLILGSLRMLFQQGSDGGIFIDSKARAASAQRIFRSWEES